MNTTIIPKAVPTFAAANAARSTAAAPNGYALAEKLGGGHGPAASVEISSAARRASSTGQAHAPAHKTRPLNIIWGDSPR